MVEIAVAIIGLVGVVFTVLASAKETRESFKNSLEINQAVTKNDIDHIKNEIEEMKKDIKEHNGYAKMFQEAIAVLKDRAERQEKQIDSLK